jgi:hypothetical protein
MQPILKTKKTLIASALALGVTNVWAGTANFTIAASTIPDVTVTQDQALSFGTAMRVTTGLTCTLDAAIPGEGTLNYDSNGDATLDGDDATFGALTGTGCINGTGNGSQAGLYTITGTGGSTVAITLAPLVETEFTFTPGNGCVPTYDGNNGTADATGDPCTALGNGTTTSLLIPDATTEQHTTAPGGTASIVNSLKFSLGGQIAVTNGGADLDPATLYSAQFDVTVVYE